VNCERGLLVESGTLNSERSGDHAGGVAGTIHDSPQNLVLDLDLNLDIFSLSGWWFEKVCIFDL
jgi:hypothetical protein